MSILRKAWLLGLAYTAVGSAQAAAPAVAAPWARATPPSAQTGAIYLTLRAEPADRLVGAASPAAREVQIHTHVTENGLHRMVQLPHLELPTDTTVTLEPGGLHLMLIDLTGPLVAGGTVNLTLEFANAGRIDVTVPVQDARARGPSHGAH